MRAKLHGWHEDEHVYETPEYVQPQPQSPPVPRQSTRGRSSRDFAAQSTPAEVIADPDFNTQLRKQVDTLVAQRMGQDATRVPATTTDPNAALGQEIAAAIAKHQSQTGRAPSSPFPAAPVTPATNQSPAYHELLANMNAMSDRLARIELNQQSGSRSEPAAYSQPASLPPITDDLQRRNNRQAAEQNKHNQETLRKTYGTVPRPTAPQLPPTSSTFSPRRDVTLVAHDESVSAAVDRELGLLRQELELLHQSLDESSTARRTTRESSPAKSAAPPEPADELRQEMQRVLRRMAIEGLKGRTASSPVSAPAPAANPLPIPRGSDLPASVPIDASSPLSLGTSLYRSGNYKAAEEAFRALDTAKLSPENRALVQYLLGACLRRQGKTSEAVQVFERLTSADGPVSEYARWQLNSLQWQQNLETQIQQLQQLRQAAVSATP